MRIARALAAAALTLGLASTLAPAQAAPAPVVAQVARTHVHAAAAKANTKLTAKAPKTAKVGKTIKITGKLTHKTKSGYKPLAKKKVGLVYLNEAGGPVIKEATTNDKGGYTLSFKPEAWQAGQSLRFVTWYYGNSTNKEANSKLFFIEVAKK